MGLKGRSLDRYLREELGLSAGLGEKLAVQKGFGQADIENDLVDPKSGDSRLEESFNRIFSYGPIPVVFLMRERVSKDVTIRVNRGRCAELPACERFSVLNLLRNGTFAEDNPNIRARHHFHDPIKEHEPPDGNRGMENKEEGKIFEPFDDWYLALARGGGDFDFTGFSARDRALALAGAARPDVEKEENFFSLLDAERYLYRSLVAAAEDEREHYLALHFVAVGHAMHLLQDMTSPAHVRNDFAGDHLSIDQGRTLEARGESKSADRLLGELAFSSFSSKAHEFLSRQDEARFGFDLADYFSSVPALRAEDPTNPFDAHDFWENLDPERPGVAQIVNQRFFSRKTVLDDVAERLGYEAPAVPNCSTVGNSKTSGGQRVWVSTLPPRRIDGSLGYVHPEEEHWRFLSSAQVPHLAKCRFHSVIRPGESEARPVISDQAWVIEESVQRDYLEVLLSMAIDHTEKFLWFYFSQRLEVIRVGEREFRLKNPTSLPFVAQADAVEVVFETLDGGRRREAVNCGTSNTFTLASSSESDFTCTLPEALEVPPANRADFWIVVRGQHGTRGSPVERDAIGDEDSWRSKDYVVAFDHVQPQLLLGMHDGAEGGDLDLRNDVWALPVDLLRPLPEGEDNLIDSFDRMKNLTASLRDETGSPAVDFIEPAGEVAGTRIALRSDRNATGVSTNFPDLAAPVRVYVYDPIEQPTSLVEIPASEIDTDFRQYYRLHWSQDGEALFFFTGRAARHRFAGPVTEPFDNEEVFCPSILTLPESLAVGDERDVCTRIESLSARNESELLVSTLCLRERVVSLTPQTSGAVFAEWVPVTPLKREVRVAVVGPSPRAPGHLEARLTDRVDVATGRIVPCGGTPGTCWERSGEPDGEDGAEELWPMWSPDGTRFAFLRDPSPGDDGSEASGGEELWVADRATRTVRRVLGREHGDLGRFAWDPAGRRLVLGISHEGRFDVVTVDPDGPDSQAPSRVARFPDQPKFSLYAPLLLPAAGP